MGAVTSASGAAPGVLAFPHPRRGHSQAERRPGPQRRLPGSLRKTLVSAALIAERGPAGFAVAKLARAVGISQGAPYRHFRDREAIVAEVARRGFEQLGAELDVARQSARTDLVAALERCAQAHLAFAARNGEAYAAMFEGGFPVTGHPDVVCACEAAFAVVQSRASSVRPEPRPAPAAGAGDGRALLPMPPEALLEAGLLIYLRSLDTPAGETA